MIRACVSACIAHIALRFSEYIADMALALIYIADMALALIYIADTVLAVAAARARAISVLKT